MNDETVIKTKFIKFNVRISTYLVSLLQHNVKHKLIFLMTGHDLNNLFLHTGPIFGVHEPCPFSTMNNQQTCKLQSAKYLKDPILPQGDSSCLP